MQVESDDLEIIGLAHLYPALERNVVFLATMDIRAHSISFATRPRRPNGPPDHERAGETFSVMRPRETRSRNAMAPDESRPTK